VRSLSRECRVSGMEAPETVYQMPSGAVSAAEPVTGLMVAKPQPLPCIKLYVVISSHHNNQAQSPAYLASTGPYEMKNTAI